MAAEKKRMQKKRIINKTDPHVRLYTKIRERKEKRK